MSTVDRRLPPPDLETRLKSWMSDQAPDADLTSTYHAIVEATHGARQRRTFRFSAASPWPSRRWPWWSDRSSAVIAVLVVVAVAVALAASVVLVGGPPPVVPDVVPTAVVPTAVLPSPVVPPTARAIEEFVKIDDLATSRVFEPTVFFRVSARLPGSPTELDICPTLLTSVRAIVLTHPKGCVEELRFIRPWAVACGTAGQHPDADTLAAAILSLGAASPPADLGDLQTAAVVPARMFAGRYHGRVIRMDRGGPAFSSTTEDPDHCRLLAEPGSGDDDVELRTDVTALVLLVDVDGELVVIRASVGGHDLASAIEAQARGYANGGPDEAAHLLGLVYDIRFGSPP